SQLEVACTVAGDIEEDIKCNGGNGDAWVNHDSISKGVNQSEFKIITVSHFTKIMGRDKVRKGGNDRNLQWLCGRRRKHWEEVLQDTDARNLDNLRRIFCNCLESSLEI